MKYKCKSKNDEKYFLKSRQKKDINGNNSLHHAFNIKNQALRYKFIDLITKEKVGDLNKPNIMGLMPHEIEHT